MRRTILYLIIFLAVPVFLHTRRSPDHRKRVVESIREGPPQYCPIDRLVPNTRSWISFNRRSASARILQICILISFGNQLAGCGQHENSEIQKMQNKNVITIEDKTVGVVRLGELINISQPVKDGKIYVVIVEPGYMNGGEDSRIGFIVDSLEEKQKVVIKPLDNLSGRKSGVSGVTILGDGQAALILDPLELFLIAQRIN